MIGYILVLVSYSIFHSSYTDIKRVPIFRRPLAFGQDSKIDLMRFSVGIPVFIAFASAFTIMQWLDVLIYTLSLRLGIFILLSFIPLLFPSTKRYNGHLFFFSFIVTIITLLYYFSVELIFF